MADRAAAVRALLESQQHGVLATLSARHDGWPFASVTPYALTEDGQPILLLSQLAEHTRNLLADPRASLFVQEAGEDPQAVARVTLLGRVELADAVELRTRYVSRHPQAMDYFAMADFGLYVLRTETARFVGGFGDMGWVEAAALGNR
ncbi:MAG TPA: pyridoxamine 5'-phosphate oxidase family protein [Chloroflexota bacterium]